MYGPLGLVNHLNLLPRGGTLGPQAEHARKGNVIRSRDRYESGHDMTRETVTSENNVAEDKKIGV